MRKELSRDNLYFIQLNLKKDKHEDLIEWIKEQAEKKEQSLSAFCINILKEYFAEDIKDGENK